MHVWKYLFVRACERNEAIRQADLWCDEQCGREFFDNYEIQSRDVKPLSDMKDFIQGSLLDTENDLARFRTELKDAQEQGSHTLEARAARHLSDMLYENPCEDMPWYNTDYGDWTVPPVEEQENYWAVMVDFHY